MSTYYSQYNLHTWAHGDSAIRTSRGGFIVNGRSDCTLNPGGVRVGSGEYYRYISFRIHDNLDSYQRAYIHI